MSQSYLGRRRFKKIFGRAAEVYMSNQLRRRRVAVFLLAALISPLIVSAQSQEPHSEEGLTMAQALTRALRESPALASFPFALRAAEAKKVQAGLSANPRIAIQLENVAGTGNVSGVRSLETTLMLSQLLELGGKRERRTMVAARNLGLIEIDFDIKRLDVLAEVAKRFIHTARDQQLLDVAKSAMALAQSNREAVSRRVESARAMRVELHRAEIELARTEISLEHREHELLSSKRRLAAAWGKDVVDFNDVRADLFIQPATRELDQLLSELRDSPDMRRFLSESRVNEAELELEQARAIPNARIGAGIRRLEGINDQAFVIDFSVGLPVFNRNQGNITAARERLQQVTTDAEARYIDAQAILFTTYQELRHARTETELLNESIIPQSREVLAIFQAGYASGRFSYLEVSEARREFIQTRAESIRTAASYHTFLIEIERLTGIGFGVDGKPKP